MGPIITLPDAKLVVVDSQNMHQIALPKDLGMMFSRCMSSSQLCRVYDSKKERRGKECPMVMPKKCTQISSPS